MAAGKNSLKSKSKKKVSLKKSGDGLPKDVTGQMLFVGSVVTVPYPDKLTSGPIMKLGVVRQLFKNGKAKVRVQIDPELFDFVMYEAASSMLTLIDIDRLPLKDALFEAVKMASKQIEHDDILDQELKK